MRIHRAVAAVASAIFPGVGQLIQGRYLIGAVQFATAAALATWWTREGGAIVLRRIQQSPDYRPSTDWWLAALGVIVVAVWSIVDAARQKSGTRQPESKVSES